MDVYSKYIDGVKISKDKRNIIIKENGFQYINPKEFMLIAHGWSKDDEPINDEYDVDSLIKRIELLESIISSSKMG